MRFARRHLAAGLSAFGGTALVLGAIILMNQQGHVGGGDDEERGTAIQIEKREAPKSDRPLPRRPPPKRAPRRTAPAPVVSLEAGLAGLDFGLPQFENEPLGDPASLLGDGDAVMTDETADTPPRPVLQTPMAFPPAAKAKGVTGYVVLSLLIGPDGSIEKVKVVESSPPGVFDDAAAAGVRNWRFEPASYQGAPVRVWARQKISFNLG